MTRRHPAGAAAGAEPAAAARRAREAGSRAAAAVPTQLRRRRTGPSQHRCTAPAPRQRTAPAARGSFVVQLGSFGSRDNADRLVRDMTAKGFTAFVAPITSDGRELYRVRVGPTRDRAAAEALAAQLRRMGQSGSIVPIS